MISEESLNQDWNEMSIKHVKNFFPISAESLTPDIDIQITSYNISIQVLGKTETIVMFIDI